MPYKAGLFATSALLAALVGTNAYAQQRPAAAATTTIEELVVTAEKREQNLQDVPVAVSAFTDNKRELVGINSIQDMTNFTPGLTYNSSTDRISLRGVGRLTNVLSGDASVANYNDGVYETFAVQAGRSTLFLDRVEVLRGPQGTLYGRNAIGGAINEISKRPTEDWYAEARATYESYNHYILEAAASGPVPFYNKLQWRLSGDWDRQTDGWAKSTIPGAPDEGNVINEWFLEGQLQGKFFDDRLEFWAKYGQGVWHNGAGGPGGGSGGWTRGPFPTYEWGQAGIQLNAGFPCNPLSTAKNVVNVSTQGCTNPSEGTPWSIARVIPYVVRLPVYNTEAIHLTWHAKNFDIRYITGGVTYHYKLTGPTSTAGGSLINTSTSPITSYDLISGTNVRPQEAFDYREYNHFWSHEINLVSTWDNPLQYVLGAYYFHQTYRQPVFTHIDQDAQPQWFGPFLLPGTFCFETGGVCAPSIGRRYDNRPESEATSWAGFGQIDWKFIPDWKLTLGLRYSHDEKKGEESVRLLCWGTATCYGGFPPEVFGFLGGTPQVADITAFAVSNPAPGTPLPRGITSFTTIDPTTGLASRTYDSTWQAWTGTAGIEWQPTPDTNVYAKYSRGYKSGGFYVGIFTFLAPNAWADKESVDSWEIGLKKDFGKRLQTNFAAYYYDYKNLQVPIPVISGTGAFAQVATNFINVPKSVSYGFEAEITWLPIENLQILANYSYNDAHVEEGSALDVADPSAVQPGAKPLSPAVACGSPNPAAQTDALCDPWTGIEQRPQDLKDSPLPNAPKNKVAINGNYTFRNLWGGDVVASLTWIWRDEQFGTLFDRPYNRSPSWTQTDARLTWTSANGKNRVIVYGKNIFNQIGYDGGALGSRFAGFIVDPTKLTTPSKGIIAVNQGVFPTYSVTPPHIFGISFEHKFF
jgi:iron complex outermembrane receptor protein